MDRTCEERIRNSYQLCSRWSECTGRLHEDCNKQWNRIYNHEHPYGGNDRSNREEGMEWQWQPGWKETGKLKCKPDERKHSREDRDPEWGKQLEWNGNKPSEESKRNRHRVHLEWGKHAGGLQPDRNKQGRNHYNPYKQLFNRRDKRKRKKSLDRQ